MTGPQIPIAVWADKEKYREPGEEFNQKCGRIAGALSDNAEHYDKCYTALKHQLFLPGGRVQAAAGSAKRVTAYNCYVMRQVPDDFNGIMDVLKEAGQTLRMGGGVGYDFSAIRPKGAHIASLNTSASGPVSFMRIYDSMCGTIMSAGHRRGAQMATIRVDHPDIMEFITSKANSDQLTNFNISVLVTDKFMEAVAKDESFDLIWEGKTYDTVRAKNLWETILRNNWDWAEPGVIFIDRVNQKNNLWYIEDITATNPCGEQPLPAYGACLLGSWNLTKFVHFTVPEASIGAVKATFNYEKLKHYIPHIVRMMDNVIDETTYPLPQQEKEAKDKRRMGLGITGLANTLAVLGIEYGSDEAAEWTEDILRLIANCSYMASVELAIEKGPFPLFNAEKYKQGKFISTLDIDVQEAIYNYGIRNSHLTSIAPTGTISLTANNVSSGIEPVFSHSYERTVNKADGKEVEKVEDYALREWGIKCKTADQVTVEEHVKMLNAAQKWVDSAVSKTCNVGDSVTWEEFKEVYRQAYEGGAKGCTTFRAAGKRFGILNASTSEDVVTEETMSDETEIQGGACYIDQETGIRSCE